MRNRGLRRPGVSAAIAAAVVVGGAISVWSGAAEMQATGRETAGTAVRIALGLLAVILGAVLVINFVWGMRVVGAIRRGEGVIARWVVAPATFDMFRDLDRRLGHAGADNDYRVPRNTPPDGVEVVFTADGLLLGDTFFGLASTGLGRFTAIRLLQESPPCLEFGTALTAVVAVPRTRILTTRGLLRVPVAPDARGQTASVLAHFQGVTARQVIVKPDFWRTRMRIGICAAIVGGVAAAAGLALAARSNELGDVPLVMAITGVMTCLFGFVLTVIAWALGRAQRKA